MKLRGENDFRTDGTRSSTDSGDQFHQNMMLGAFRYRILSGYSLVGIGRTNVLSDLHFASPRDSIITHTRIFALLAGTVNHNRKKTWQGSLGPMSLPFRHGRDHGALYIAGG